MGVGRPEGSPHIRIEEVRITRERMAPVVDAPETIFRRGSSPINRSTADFFHTRKYVRICTDPRFFNYEATWNLECAAIYSLYVSDEMHCIFRSYQEAELCL